MKPGVLFAKGLVLAVASALACGPSAQEPARPPAPSAPFGLARELCEATCARAIRCEGPRAATCDCDTLRDPGLLRVEWVRAEIACLGRASCDAPDASTACETDAFRAIGAAPLSWPPIVMRCLAEGDACGGSSATCRRLAAMTDDARAEAAACFDKPCDAYASCFRAFLASRVAPAVPAWR